MQVGWVHYTKYIVDSSIDKYKAHLVAKEFSQVERVDYFEIFSPIYKMDSINFVLSLVASQGCLVYHMDVKSVFLHMGLHEVIYMEKTLGFM